MTFSLSSQEYRQIFQCHLYLLTCFTAIYFFQYDIYSSVFSSFLRKELQKTLLFFVIGVVHATTNIKDIY
jgi:hypothetical protein